MKIMHSVQLKNNRKEKIYVFDFDGTLFKTDLLYLYMVYHFFVFNDKAFISSSLISCLYKNKLSDMRKKIILRFSEKYDLYEEFKKFSKLFFLKYLLRGKLFKFIINLTNKNKKVLIITANYEALVKTFLIGCNLRENQNFSILGTPLPESGSSRHANILKGKAKVNELQNFLIKNGFSRENLEIHNFFDSYDDKYLCDISNHNILFGYSIGLKLFFKNNYNAKNFSNYLRLWSR
jgi:phosphoserine phosphatase